MRPLSDQMLMKIVQATSDIKRTEKIFDLLACSDVELLTPFFISPSKMEKLVIVRIINAAWISWWFIACVICMLMYDTTALRLMTKIANCADQAVY
jgi:hypothetical protein